MNYSAGADTRYPFQQTSSKLGAVCEGLLFKIFPQPVNENERGFVVAFTSAHSGAGVTEVTRTLAKALRCGGGELAVAMDYRSLAQYELRSAGWDLESADDEGSDWHTIHTVLGNAVDKLRRQHRYVLIDCAPIGQSQEAIRLAPLVDGIVLVVEANRTRKDQILYAERNIESAKGRILGHVLNKRTYPVPDLFHRIMTAVGI